MLEEHKKFAEWAEARRNFPYEDSVGKLTIGIGRNLEDRGLSDEEIDFLLSNDQEIVSKDIKANLKFFNNLDPTRQLVVFDMVFNMGINRFLGFVNAIKALERGDYERAAREMQDSRWFRQTGRRARALVNAMYSGQLDPAIYGET
jgi:lysozyme